jgi:TRAP-type mannitol/chloroaromatic compound transport system permease small subunit
LEKERDFQDYTSYKILLGYLCPYCSVMVYLKSQCKGNKYSEGQTSPSDTRL